MSKAGKGDGVDAGAVGSQHPVPENIPHLSSPVNGSTGSVPKHTHHGSIPGVQAGSPIKESSFLNRETSADDSQGQAVAEGETQTEAQAQDADASIPSDGASSIPIRT
jgi:hypothetical protein